MEHMVTSCVLPVVLNATVELNLLGIIARGGDAGELTAAEIAAQLTTANPDLATSMLDRMLRLLTTYSVLTCSVTSNDITGSSVRRYGLAPASKYLLPDEDGVSLAPFLTLALHPAFSESRSKLKDGILEGGVPFSMAHGMTAYEYAAIEPKFNDVFNNAMHNYSSIIIKNILMKYDGFKDVQQLVEVGGGLGHTIRAIVSKYPTIVGINFDLPHVIGNALPSLGLQHVSGDMFEKIPSGDAILLKWLIHNWTDDLCVKLLKNCYTALPKDGKVVIIEGMLSETPHIAVSEKAISQLDLIMMTHTHDGMERTREEFIALAKAAGFTRIELACCVYNSCIMELFK
ncbi:hypothetical protein RND81_03G091200 [Saponaria officinalis]|uniref:Uncharacterized protein n=1 Tax=Saponaria officinalis TaxID=3572 RepID=A0AAW1M649_SAPOF